MKSAKQLIFVLDGLFEMISAILEGVFWRRLPFSSLRLKSQIKPITAIPQLNTHADYLWPVAKRVEHILCGQLVTERYRARAIVCYYHRQRLNVAVKGLVEYI